MARIFISYKRVDKDKVFPIVEEIKQKTGVDCWIDLEGIESGDQFQNVIIDAIDNADIVVFMLSKNFIAPYKDEKTGKIDLKKQTFPEKEVMYALRHNKRLIPLSIDGTTVSDCKWLDFNCSGLDCIIWNNTDQRDKFYGNLIQWSGGENSWNSQIQLDSGGANDFIGQNKFAKLNIRNMFSDAFHPVVNMGIAFQAFAFMLIFLMVLWTFLFGCFAFYQHPQVSEVVLILALCTTLFATCRIHTCKSYWLGAIFVLDFIEIYLISHLGEYLYFHWHEFSSNSYPTSIRYQMLYELGHDMQKLKFMGTHLYLIYLVFIHIIAVCIILCLKKNGRSAWSLMK